VTEPPIFFWPGIVALLIGYTVGVVTSGVVPGLEKLHVGIPFLFAWFSGVLTYIPMRYIAHRRLRRAA